MSKLVLGSSAFLKTPASRTSGSRVGHDATGPEARALAEITTSMLRHVRLRVLYIHGVSGGSRRGTPTAPYSPLLLLLLIFLLNARVLELN